MAGNLIIIMHRHDVIILAGVVSVALPIGAGLGGYTLLGSHMREPVDVIGEAAARTRTVALRDDEPVPAAPVDHVCTGCDAKLYRDEGWYAAPEPAPPAEDPSPDGRALWAAEASGERDRADDDEAETAPDAVGAPDEESSGAALAELNLGN